MEDNETKLQNGRNVQRKTGDRNTNLTKLVDGRPPRKVREEAELFPEEFADIPYAIGERKRELISAECDSNNTQDHSVHVQIKRALICRDQRKEVAEIGSEIDENTGCEGNSAFHLNGKVRGSDNNSNKNGQVYGQNNDHKSPAASCWTGALISTKEFTNNNGYERRMIRPNGKTRMKNRNTRYFKSHPFYRKRSSGLVKKRNVKERCKSTMTAKHAFPAKSRRLSQIRVSPRTITTTEKNIKTTTKINDCPKGAFSSATGYNNEVLPVKGQYERKRIMLNIEAEDIEQREPRTDEVTERGDSATSCSHAQHPNESGGTEMEQSTLVTAGKTPKRIRGKESFTSVLRRPRHKYRRARAGHSRGQTHHGEARIKLVTRARQVSSTKIPPRCGKVKALQALSTRKRRYKRKRVHTESIKALPIKVPKDDSTPKSRGKGHIEKTEISNKDVIHQDYELNGNKNLLIIDEQRKEMEESHKAKKEIEAIEVPSVTSPVCPTGEGKEGILVPESEKMEEENTCNTSLSSPYGGINTAFIPVNSLGGSESDTDKEKAATKTIFVDAPVAETVVIMSGNVHTLYLPIKPQREEPQSDKTNFFEVPSADEASTSNVGNSTGIYEHNVQQLSTPMHCSRSDHATERDQTQISIMHQDLPNLVTEISVKEPNKATELGTVESITPEMIAQRIMTELLNEVEDIIGKDEIVHNGVTKNRKPESEGLCVELCEGKLTVRDEEKEYSHKYFEEYINNRSRVESDEKIFETQDHTIKGYCETKINHSPSQSTDLLKPVQISTGEFPLNSKIVEKLGDNKEKKQHIAKTTVKLSNHQHNCNGSGRSNHQDQSGKLNSEVNKSNATAETEIPHLMKSNLSSNQITSEVGKTSLLPDIERATSAMAESWRLSESKELVQSNCPSNLQRKRYMRGRAGSRKHKKKFKCLRVKNRNALKLKRPTEQGTTSKVQGIPSSCESPGCLEVHCQQESDNCHGTKVKGNDSLDNQAGSQNSSETNKLNPSDRFHRSARNTAMVAIAEYQAKRKYVRRQSVAVKLKQAKNRRCQSGKVPTMKCKQLTINLVDVLSSLGVKSIVHPVHADYFVDHSANVARISMDQQNDVNQADDEPPCISDNTSVINGMHTKPQNMPVVAVLPTYGTTDDHNTLPDKQFDQNVKFINRYSDENGITHEKVKQTARKSLQVIKRRKKMKIKFNFNKSMRGKALNQKPRKNVVKQSQHEWKPKRLILKKAKRPRNGSSISVVGLDKRVALQCPHTTSFPGNHIPSSCNSSKNQNSVEMAVNTSTTDQPMSLHCPSSGDITAGRNDFVISSLKDSINRTEPKGPSYPPEITKLTQINNVRKKKKGRSNWKYKCLQCPYYTAAKGTIIEHIYGHTQHKPFVCRICDTRYGSKVGAMGHHRRKHQYSLPDVKKEVLIEETQFYTRVTTRLCNDKPGYELKTPNDNVFLDTNEPELLKGQSRSHAGDNQSSLPIHGGKKPIQIGRNGHIKSGSKGKDPYKIEPKKPGLREEYYQCSYCTFACDNQGMMEGHIEKCHRTEQRFRCVMCGLSFKNEDTTVQHYDTRHPGEWAQLIREPNFSMVRRKEVMLGQASVRKRKEKKQNLKKIATRRPGPKNVQAQETKAAFNDNETELRVGSVESETEPIIISASPETENTNDGEKQMSPDTTNVVFENGAQGTTQSHRDEEKERSQTTNEFTFKIVDVYSLNDMESNDIQFQREAEYIPVEDLNLNALNESMANKPEYQTNHLTAFEAEFNSNFTIDTNMVDGSSVGGNIKTNDATLSDTSLREDLNNSVDRHFVAPSWQSTVDQKHLFENDDQNVNNFSVSSPTTLREDNEIDLTSISAIVTPNQASNVDDGGCSPRTADPNRASSKRCSNMHRRYDRLGGCSVQVFSQEEPHPAHKATRLESIAFRLRPEIKETFANDCERYRPVSSHTATVSQNNVQSMHRIFKNGQLEPGEIRQEAKSAVVTSGIRFIPLRAISPSSSSYPSSRFITAGPVANIAPVTGPRLIRPAPYPGQRSTPVAYRSRLPSFQIRHERRPQTERYPASGVFPVAPKTRPQAPQVPSLSGSPAHSVRVEMGPLGVPNKALPVTSSVISQASSSPGIRPLQGQRNYQNVVGSPPYRFLTQRLTTSVPLNSTDYSSFNLRLNSTSNSRHMVDMRPRTTQHATVLEQPQSSCQNPNSNLDIYTNSSYHADYSSTVKNDRISDTVPSAPYKCPFCRVQSFSKQYIEKHQKCHEGILYMCPYCALPTKFSQKDILDHICLVHPGCPMSVI